MFDISPVGELCKVGLSSNWSFSSLRYHYLFFSQRELSKLTSPCFRLLRWTRHVSSDVSEWIIAHLRHNSVALLTHGRTCRLSGGYGCRKVCRALLFVLINSWYGFPQTCWLSCFHFFFLLSYFKNSIVTSLSCLCLLPCFLSVSYYSHTQIVRLNAAFPGADTFIVVFCTMTVLPSFGLWQRNLIG